MRGKDAKTDPVTPSELTVLDEGEVIGVGAVAVEYIDMKKNAECDGRGTAPD